jgi:hypothetical protein
MTKKEHRAVEQRTRIDEARYLLRSIADDADPPPEPIESEMRTIARRLMEIENSIEVTVRKERTKEGE